MMGRLRRSSIRRFVLPACVDGKIPESGSFSTRVRCCVTGCPKKFSKSIPSSRRLTDRGSWTDVRVENGSSVSFDATIALLKRASKRLVSNAVSS